MINSLEAILDLGLRTKKKEIGRKAAKTSKTGKKIIYLNAIPSLHFILPHTNNCITLNNLYQ